MTRPSQTSLLLVLCCAVIGADITEQEDEPERYICEETELDRLDQLSARILSLNEYQRPFPEQVSQVPRYCKETKEDLAQVAVQNDKCLKGTSKHFSSIIQYSVKTMMKQYCNMRNKRRIHNSLVMGRCVNKNLKKSNACLARYIDALQRGKRAEPAANRIGYACCDYFKLINCLDTVTRSNCSPRAADMIQDFVRNLFTSIVDVACGDFVEHSDTCDHLPEAPMKQRSDRAVRTFTLPLVELWNHL